MEDEVQGGWQVDPATRVALRVESVKKALEQGDLSSAIVEAEELLDEEPDHAEGLFLLAEAMLEGGDAQGSVSVYEYYLKASKDEAGAASFKPAALCGLGVARFESCDIPSAVEALREAIRLSPDLAEAHYTLALAVERLPDEDSAKRAANRNASLKSLVAANRLDPEAYPFPAELTATEWNDALVNALSTLAPRLAEFWRGVPIRLLELPSLEELRSADPALPPTVAALYEGTPPEEGDPWEIRPTALRVFTRNLARAGKFDRIVVELARALQGEALEWLGVSVEDVESQ